MKTYNCFFTVSGRIAVQNFDGDARKIERETKRFLRLALDNATAKDIEIDCLDIEELEVE